MAFLMILYILMLSMLMILLFTLSVSRHLDILQQLELNSKLESDLWYTVDWGGSVFLISLRQKNSLFYLTGLIILVLLMWKWIVLFLKKHHLLRCRDYLSLLNWSGALLLSLLLKLPLRKYEPWFVLWSFFLLRLLFISVSLPYSVAWNTVAVSGLVHLAATWIC